MRLYRFELTFCDEPQDVGLFQGLEDALPGNEVMYITKTLFAALPEPEVAEEFSYEPLCCWFTEAGLDKFMEELKFVTAHLAAVGWGVCAAVIEVGSLEYAAYKDADQVVFPVEYLQKCYDLEVIERIEDVKKLLPSA